MTRLSSEPPARAAERQKQAVLLEGKLHAVGMGGADTKKLGELVADRKLASQDDVDEVIRDGVMQRRRAVAVDRVDLRTALYEKLENRVARVDLFLSPPIRSIGVSVISSAPEAFEGDVERRLSLIHI